MTQTVNESLPSWRKTLIMLSVWRRKAFMTFPLSFLRSSKPSRVR